MAKITNIGVLNVMDIKEEIANEITELKNIGLLIESDKSQALLSKCKKINIGSTIKIPLDLNFKIIATNGESKIDKEFLEGLIDPVIFLVNGSMEISNDVEVQLFNEKVYKILLNGTLICPKNIKGILESKSTINGLTHCYNSDYKYISKNIRLNNKFLKGLKNNSKLAFDKLIIIDKIDLNLLEERIANLQILNKLIMSEEYEDKISQIVDEYYDVNTIVVPEGEGEIKYFSEKIIIDDKFIREFNRDTLFVDGSVEIYLKEEIKIADHIKFLACESVICNKEYYNQIKDVVADGVDIKIVEGRLIDNLGKMVLSEDYNANDRVTIRNYGKITVEESYDIKKLEGIASIINFGAIEVPLDKMSALKSKIKENYGKIKEKVNDEGVKLDKEDEDILYSNIGELKL